MTGMGARSRGLVLASIVAVIVLAPYATVALSFRHSLYVQAGLVLGAVSAGLGIGIAGGGWPLRIGPRSISVGLGLFGAAAVLATAVALVRGNDLPRIAGQLVSMALLPLGAAAASSLGSEGSRRPFALAVLGSVCLASVVHLGFWAAEVAAGRVAMRLIFPNAVSVIGPSLFAWVLALAAAGSPSARMRRAGLVALPIVTLYVVGTVTRSLWVVTAVATMAYAVGRRGWRAMLGWRAMAMGGGAAVVALALAWGACLWLQRPRDSSVPPSVRAEFVRAAEAHSYPGPRSGAGPAGVMTWTWGAAHAGRRIESKTFPTGGGGGYRLETCLLTAAQGRGRVDLQWLDPEGRPLGALRMWLHPEVSGCRARFQVAPPGAVRARLRLEALSEEGHYELGTPSVHRLGPGFVTALALQVDFVTERLVSLWRDVAASDSEALERSTVRFRVLETLRVLELFGESPWGAKLFGHGLGATFPLDLWGYDNRGHWIRYGRAHYIHDFYAFLPYKTGIVGSLAVLAALALWIAALLDGVRRKRPAGRFDTAALALFVAGAVWSLSSPVFLDFRLAPLWGMLLILGAQPAAAGGEDPAAPPRSSEDDL